MKKFVLLLSLLLMTSCTTAKNLTDGTMDKIKNLGKNPCYNKETNVVVIGCKK